MKQSKISVSALVFGLLVVSAGALLLAFSAGMLPPEYKPILFSWQMALIALGFTGLFSRHKSFMGLILMLAGGFFLLPKLDIPSLSFLKGNGWALVLIVLGIFILCKVIFGKPWWRFEYYCSSDNHHGREKSFHREMREKFHERNYGNKAPRNEAGYIDRDFVFGGSREKITVSDFKGGEINCVFGGIELDLSESQLAEGVHYLEINSVFGGVVLYIPADWKIEIRQHRVFGAFEDNRPQSNFEVDENRVLIIQSSVIFGGGEIKCK